MRHSLSCISILLSGLIGMGVLIVPLRSNAQWASVSAGGTDTVGGVIISSSLGEWYVQSIDFADGQIQFGVQQPYHVPFLQTRVIGSLLYSNNASTPLVGTVVELHRDGQIRASAITDVGGGFDLGMVDTGLYQLSFVNPAPWRGVNSTDALGVLRHFAGQYLLQGLYVRAADVNARNMVNAFEAQSIARRTIRLVNQFTAGDWLYDQDALLIAPQSTLQNTPISLPIKTLCYGDVNGSYSPGAPLRFGWQTIESLGFVDTKSTGEAFEWPIHWVEGGSIGAITLEMQIPDGIEVDHVEVGTGQTGWTDGNLYYLQLGNVIRISWYGLNPMQVKAGGELLRLKVRGRAEGAWQLGAASELADGWARPLPDFRLSMPDQSTEALKVRVMPNPVGQHARLLCSVPADGRISYYLIDALGRVVWTGEDLSKQASIVEVDLPADNWQQGTYTLRINWQGADQQEQKILKIIK